MTDLPTKPDALDIAPLEELSRQAAETRLRAVRMVEQVQGSGLYTPDRKLPSCPACDEDELWAHPCAPPRENFFGCYRCSYEFACPSQVAP